MLKLTYSNLKFHNFPGEDPRTPLFNGRGGEERKGKGKEKDREGMDGKGQGREGGEEWGVGRGGEGRSTWAPPPPLETSSGSAPINVPCSGISLDTDHDRCRPSRNKCFRRRRTTFPCTEISRLYHTSTYSTVQQGNGAGLFLQVTTVVKVVL